MPKIPSVRDYRAAFLAIENDISPKQREIIVANFLAPNHTITAAELANKVGFASWSGTNLQYGMLAKRICRELGIRAPKVAVTILVGVGDHTPSAHHPLVLHEPVVAAIDELGWARPPRTFLLLWNPIEKESQWNWDSSDYNEIVKRTTGLKSVPSDWSTGNRIDMRAGERFYLLRQRMDRGIVGSGVIASKPYPGGKGAKRKLYVDINFESLLPVANRLKIETLQKTVPSPVWNSTRASGQQVDESLVARLDQLWSKHLRTNGRVSHIPPPADQPNKCRFWRMSFRMGTDGPEMWPKCLSAGVAAITYGPLANIDLSNVAPGEPKHLWRQLSSGQHHSIRSFVGTMKVGDIIYVKQGPVIVGKGVVKSRYRFDRTKRIVDSDGDPWRHQRQVTWDTSFSPVTCQLGDQPRNTLRELQPSNVSEFESQRAGKSADISAVEGEMLQKQINFRTRNRKLIATAKARSDGKCEVCSFSFAEFYGSIGDGYIVAHHLDPIGERTTASMTTLDDISLVCPNCHAMLHTHPCPTVHQLRGVVRKRRRARS